jgi:hypothetical protein
MWDETYIFCPFSHGTKYSSIGFMQDLLKLSVVSGQWADVRGRVTRLLTTDH